MSNRGRERDEDISQFIPRQALPPCELCDFFPVHIRTDPLVRQLDRKIAKLEPGIRRQKLERRRQQLSRSDAITLYLHGNKEFFTFPMLKAAIPGVTVANWALVRDYIFYGPRATPPRGPGSFLYSVADRFCPRKTMHTIIGPALTDLRLEYSETTEEDRFWAAIYVRVRAEWNFVRVLMLCLAGKGR